MIDFQSEELISLADAAKLLPRRRAGRPVHVSCVYRWTQLGVKGIILESSQCGGGRVTSREALQRFFDRLTEQVESGRAPIPAPTRLSDQRRKSIEAAEKKLAAAGI